MDYKERILKAIAEYDVEDEDFDTMEGKAFVLGIRFALRKIIPVIIEEEMNDET